MLPHRPDPVLRPVRPRLPRRALPWWLGILALAGATGLVVHGALRRAADAEAAYGRTRPVAVVARPVEAGTPLADGDVEVRRWPLALAPPGALDHRPAGRTALVDLAPGEPLLASRVSGGPGRGPAALLDPGERAVAVPVVAPTPPLRVGDVVDVLAAAPPPDPTVDPTAPGPPVAAAGATVVHVSEEAVVVAVDRAGAAGIAVALARGPVLLALLPPGG